MLSSILYNPTFKMQAALNTAFTAIKAIGAFVSNTFSFLFKTLSLLRCIIVLVLGHLTWVPDKGPEYVGYAICLCLRFILFCWFLVHCKDERERLEEFELEWEQEIPYIVAYQCKFLNFLGRCTPDGGHSMPGGKIDLVDDIDDDVPLIWWNRIIRFIRFIGMSIRFLADMILVAFAILRFLLAPLFSMLRRVQQFCKEHIDIRPIDIIGLFAIILTLRIARILDECLWSACRKVNARIPVVRLLRVVFGFIRQSLASEKPPPPPPPSSTGIYGFIVNYEGCIWIAAFALFVALLHWNESRERQKQAEIESEQDEYDVEDLL
ncbi:hypothetical protein NliqN6_0888 [Naganishia liquefaciens]|uniref:Uncharacterized protein n=1 Tax=Naganishia liquefaciens TaxID=104408 RepID=A0A8H3TPE0_9TREE|nr:hypothetical protein NliqN6_0888 [Naganishia liquefaciens]